MIYKIIEYVHANPIESKIISFTTLGSIIAPIDVVLKYIVPIASAVTWYFLKPILDKRFRNKNKDEGE